MRSNIVRTFTAVLTVNALFMNQALAVVSETLMNSPITERQHCTVHKKSTNTTLDAACGYKIDERGQRIKYREFYDDKIDRLVQQYQRSPAIFNSAGVKTKDAVFEEVKVVIERGEAPATQSTSNESVEQAPPQNRFQSQNVDLFARPDRQDETDQKMAKGTKLLLISGAVLGVVGFGYGGYRVFRRPAKRTGNVAAPQISTKSMQTVAEAPKTVTFKKNPMFKKGQQVAVKGHLPESSVPRGARRFTTDQGRTVVVYQDPFSNQLLTYMIWNDMLLSHPISYGQPIQFSGSRAAAPIMDGTVPYARGDEPVFAQPSANEIARPNVSAPAEFVVRGTVESDVVIRSSESDYGNTVLDRTPEPTRAPAPYESSSPAPAPRDWMDTPPSPAPEPAPAPYDPPSPAPEPAPAPYDPPAPAPEPAPPSDYS